MYEYTTVFSQQLKLEILVFKVFSVFFSALLHMILEFMDKSFIVNVLTPYCKVKLSIP